MERDKLKEFFLDKHMQAAVRNGLTEHLQEEVIARVFTGKDVGGYKEAGDIIESFFKKIDHKYSEKRASASSSR